MPAPTEEGVHAIVLADHESIADTSGGRIAGPGPVTVTVTANGRVTAS